MIYTLTFNPSIDYEMHLDRFKLNETNRSKNEIYRLGGKGINVSVVLKSLGFDSTVLGFVGGFVGDQILSMIHEKGIMEKMIPLEEGISRMNIKLANPIDTEINAAGPLITGYDMKRLFDQLDELKKEDILVLSGSVPTCLDEHLYETILNVLMNRGVLCVVDASGALLFNSLKAHPFLIKPNVVECEDILHVKIYNKKDAQSAAKQLQQLGAKNVLISMGKDGAVLVDEKGSVFESSSLQGKCISSVGCGDSMVAGFLAAFIKCSNSEEAFLMAMACGCATAFSEGLAGIDKIRECYAKMEVKK